MKYFFRKFKKQLLRLLAAVLVFGAAMLVLLYFLGYYDFSFLDRYKVLGVIFEDPLPQTQTGPSMFFDPSELIGDDYLEEEPEDILPEDSSQTAENPSQGTSGGNGGGGSGVDLSSYETKSVKSVYDEKQLADKLLRTDKTGAFTVDKLLSEGYHISGISYSEAGLNFVPPAEPEPAEGEDASGNAEPAETDEADSVPKVVTGTYVPGETVLGRMTFSFQLPERYSLRNREKIQKVIHYPLDDSEYYVTEKSVQEQRPAIELYMGYILMDDGKTLSMIASDATPLSVMDETVYAPAFARDRYDRPLFYRTSETGETQYVYLAMDGKNFIRTEYDELEEGRGLNFDYPASYGKTDSSITTDKNGVTGKMAYVNKGVGMVTGYDFTDAFAFSEGLAAVTTTKNRNGMYFIDENGKRAFETWIYYFNEHNRDGYANLVKPLTNGIENIGFYYFENGLTRVRTQTIDAYNWAYVRRIRLMRDEHILIRPDGSEYELPAGYQLEGYSDGMILLSKDDRYGFIDYTGEWIAQPIYTSATPFVCGLATLKTEDGRVGMIDTEGNIVLQFTYDYISQVSDGLIAAYRRENGWTILKMMEKDV
ncbi:MAG: WG repeat-containing protein [Clostridia bacterium]|nr:WG repeat-containing protein [Clostridia bacterium]